MSPDDIAYHLRWKASSGAPGGWRVTRQDFRPGADRYLQELKGKSGRVIYFRTYTGAKNRANFLNNVAPGDAMSGREPDHKAIHIKHPVRIYVRRYRDNGQVLAYVDWADGSRTEATADKTRHWQSNRTWVTFEFGMHMHALFARGKRLGLKLERETW